MIYFGGDLSYGLLGLFCGRGISGVFVSVLVWLKRGDDASDVRYDPEPESGDTPNSNCT